jgi:hypothetical protein
MTYPSKNTVIHGFSYEKNIPSSENVMADDFVNVDNSLETRLNPSETDIVNQMRMKNSKDQYTHSSSDDSDVQEF